MTSPENEIKEQIRHEYAKTYPNIIFTLINSLVAKKHRIMELEAQLANKDGKSPESKT